jgi:hypothetical protein
VTPTPDGTGRPRDDEIVEFGRGRAVSRRWTRALLAGLVLAAVAVIVVQAGGHHGPPAAKAPPPPPAVRVTAVGHRLLGVTAGWQLFARGPDDLVQVQFARGRIIRTYVPPLESASPDVALVTGDRRAIIRSSDLVPGYVVPDGRQARVLTGPLAGDGPLIPGAAGTQTAWALSGPPTSPDLALVTLTGHRAGPVIRFPDGGPQLPATAVSDGRGGVLVTSSNTDIYDAGPQFDRPVSGLVIAVGPANWLTVTCDTPNRPCRNEVIGTVGGARRVLPGSAAAEPYYFSWPPTGVIAPDGGTAALIEDGPDNSLTVHLINLRTGASTDLGVRLSVAGSVSNNQTMAWSPDSRWLFVAAARGRLVAVDTRTGRAERLGVTLPAVDQLAIRP